ncbi:hypothetical protein [Flexibacterium corallicola]|uniref:hypothetical protein n=1 Tax=Flexibacterium corallicola TaxID=3037259 RepID=UPI00286EDA35|nr:hypothetical protein [Pseudovibrio sp. M1P-2-3]
MTRIPKECPYHLPVALFVFVLPLAVVIPLVMGGGSLKGTALKGSKESAVVTKTQAARVSGGHPLSLNKNRSNSSTSEVAIENTALSKNTKEKKVQGLNFEPLKN